MSSTSGKSNNVWFKKVRGSYLPVIWRGWLTYLPFLLFLLVTFLKVDQSSTSATEIVIDLLPYWVSAVVVMHWFASKMS